MLHELGKNDYERVRPLFKGLAYQLTTRTVIYLEQAFKAGDATSGDCHTAARAWAVLGEREVAVHRFEQALDTGWTHVEFTPRCEELEPLHGTEEWDDLLARLGE